jgi:hypothetical protein
VLRLIGAAMSPAVETTHINGGFDMSWQRVLLALLVLSCALFLGSCSSGTQLTVEWKDADHVGRVQNVMVIGVAERMVVRRAFEDELAKQLLENGATASSSARVLPADTKIEKEVIKAEIERLNLDAVLVTRLLDVEETTEYVPGTTTMVYTQPYYRGMYPYYHTVYEAVHTPGYTIESTVVTLETNLYDAGREALIWSAQSETFDPGSVESAIKEVAKTIVEGMVARGLIGP